VLVNAANVTAAGPLALALNLLPPLFEAAPEVKFTVLAPSGSPLSSLPAYPNVALEPRPVQRGLRNDLARLADLFNGIPRVARRTAADACLTLGDLGPLGLPCPQVLFVHNPLFVYSAEELDGVHAWSPLKRRFLRWHLSRSVREAAAVIVQTPVMADRLRDQYPIPPGRLHELAQPVPAHARLAGRAAPDPTIAGCPKPIRLLVLAAYYPHKNHRVLPAVAAELKRRNLESQVQIFVTLDTMDQATRVVQRALAEHSDVLTNLGALPRERVAGALAASSALLLPTLVETYGLIYPEAMHAGIPILTSDRDFARWMCGPAALYFDPRSAESIVDAIQALDEFGSKQDLAALYAERLARLPAGWDEVAGHFLEILMQAAGPVRRGGDLEKGAR
jgi:glycosyltransferase involved in cell wall biosynthesis